MNPTNYALELKTDYWASWIIRFVIGVKSFLHLTDKLSTVFGCYYP